MKVFIIAAGMGKRLRPFTVNLPKGLLPIGNDNIIGKQLKNAKLPSDISIGAIVRNDKVITPKGDTVIEQGDRVVVFSLHEAVHKLETFFSVDVGFF